MEYNRGNLISRNIVVAGRRTSVRLGPEMWDALAELCRRERMTASEVVTEIDRDRATASLTSRIRAYLLSYFRSAATDEGHRRAGHGFVGRVVSFAGPALREGTDANHR